MKLHTLAATAALMVGALAAAHATDPKATIADLDARLTKIGAPKLDGTEKAGDKTVPGLFFGERKINNNYDVVDAIRKAHDATATLFVKHGACYNPIKDASGKLIGVSYIGHKN